MSTTKLSFNQHVAAVKKSLFNNEAYSHNDWSILVNKDDEIEIWPPSGDGYKTGLYNIDKAVDDFCRKAIVVPDKINVQQPDAVKVPKNVLGPDSTSKEVSFENVKVNEQVDPKKQKGFEATDPDLGPDSTIGGPWDIEFNERHIPEESKLSDPDLGADTSTKETKMSKKQKMTSPNLGKDTTTKNPKWVRNVKRKFHSRDMEAQMQQVFQGEEETPGELGSAIDEMISLLESAPEEQAFAIAQEIADEIRSKLPTQTARKRKSQTEDLNSVIDDIISMLEEAPEDQAFAVAQEIIDEIKQAIPSPEEFNIEEQPTPQPPSATARKRRAEDEKKKEKDPFDVKVNEQLGDERSDADQHSKVDQMYSDRVKKYKRESNKIVDTFSKPEVPEIYRELRAARPSRDMLEGIMDKDGWNARYALGDISIMDRSQETASDDAMTKPGPMACSEDKMAVAPPGWEETVKKMKKHEEIDNPWALAWSMKNKGYTPGGKDKKSNKTARPRGGSGAEELSRMLQGVTLLKVVDADMNRGNPYISMGEKAVSCAVVHDGSGYSPGAVLCVDNTFNADACLESAHEELEEINAGHLDKEEMDERFKAQEEEGYDPLTEKFDGKTFTLTPQELKKVVDTLSADSKFLAEKLSVIEFEEPEVEEEEEDFEEELPIENKKSRSRKAGPKIREKWDGDNGYHREIEAESPEDLHNLVKAFGGEEVEFKPVTPKEPESYEETGEEQSTKSGSMEKKSIDDKAKKYYDEYYGEYGKKLTKDVKKKKDAQQVPPAIPPKETPAVSTGDPMELEEVAPPAPGAKPAPKAPAPGGAPGAKPAPIKPTPGMGNDGLAALGWTPEDIQAMGEDDKKKILQIQLNKPGTKKPMIPTPSSAPKAPGGPIAPKTPSAPPSPDKKVPNIGMEPSIPEPGIPPSVSPKTMSKKVSQGTLDQNPNNQVPSPSAQPVQPSSDKGTGQMPPSKTAPKPAAPSMGAPEDSEGGTTEEKAFDILSEVQMSSVDATTADQVSSMKAGELSRRLLVELGIDSGKAKELYGLGRNESLIKLFK